MVASGPANARELRYATGYPSGSTGAELANRYAEALKTHSGGELTAKVYPLSLLNFAEMSGGVREGVADSGWVLLAYHPSEFARSNLVGELTMLPVLENMTGSVKGNMALGGATLEFLFNCPECQHEFGRQNQVFTAGGAGAAYWLLCTKPVVALADLKGKRIRAGGAQWARWVQAMGASLVTMSVNETFEGLSQGVIDCTVASPGELINFSLVDVVKHVTVGVPGGAYTATAPNNFNADSWRRLTPAQRSAVLRAAAVYSAHMTILYHADEQRALEAAGKRGVRLHQPEADLVSATRLFIEKDIEAIPAAYANRFGVENGGAMVAQIRELLEKWMKLVADVETAEELAELYWQQVFSRVDTAAYGL